MEYRLKKISCNKCKEKLLLKAVIFDKELNEVRLAIDCIGCGLESVIILKEDGSIVYLN